MSCKAELPVLVWVAFLLTSPNPNKLELAPRGQHWLELHTQVFILTLGLARFNSSDHPAEAPPHRSNLGGFMAADEETPGILVFCSNHWSGEAHVFGSELTCHLEPSEGRFSTATDFHTCRMTHDDGNTVAFCSSTMVRKKQLNQLEAGCEMGRVGLHGWGHWVQLSQYTFWIIEHNLANKSKIPAC